MKVTIEIDLGNEAMQTALDVSEAVAESLDVGYDATLVAGMTGAMRDCNGNTVGRWAVTS